MSGHRRACLTTLCRELCNTAELLEMPLELWAQVSSRNNVLDGVTDAPCKGAVFRGKELCSELCKNC